MTREGLYITRQPRTDSVLFSWSKIERSEDRENVTETHIAKYP